MDEKKKVKVAVKKKIKHKLFVKTGEHHQWLVKEDGTEIEIFKGDPDWEE